MSIAAGKRRSASRILVVAEEPIAQSTRTALQHSAYVIRIVRTVADAARTTLEWRPHVVVVDIDIAAGAGVALVGERRSRGAHVPTIAITERDDMDTKLAAFARGADDVLTVPFCPEELVARVLALMRRSYGERTAFSPTIHIGDVEVDLLHHRVLVGSDALELTAIEQSLLYLFATNPGRVISRETILDTLWGVDYVAESNIVDRHVRNLRAKLKDNFRRPRYIGTVAGKGYRFLLPVDPVALEFPQLA